MWGRVTWSSHKNRFSGELNMGLSQNMGLWCSSNTVKIFEMTAELNAIVNYSQFHRGSLNNINTLLINTKVADARILNK